MDKDRNNSDSLSVRKRRGDEWENETPSHRGSCNYTDDHRSSDPYATPDLYGSRDQMKNSTWDDSGLGSSRITTPRTGDRRERHRYDYTPMPTPDYKHNPWMNLASSRRLNSDNTFGSRRIGTDGSWSVREKNADTNEDNEEMRVENERIDRNWYQMDDGYDGDNNPFAGLCDN